jgi:hypothetical protein
MIFLSLENLRGVSKSFRTESVTKYTLTTINTRWEATQMVMAAKLTRITHKIAIQLQLVAESWTICSSRSRRPVRKLLDTPSYNLCNRKCFFCVTQEPYIKNRDNSVGIGLGCGLDERGSRVPFPAGAGNFSIHHLVQTGSGAHPPSYPLGTTVSFPGGKAAGEWSWPLTSM